MTYNVSMDVSNGEPDDAFLDGCDLDFTEDDPTPDDEVELMTLFAEALDPATPKTVEEAEAEWKALFNEGA